MGFQFTNLYYQYYSTDFSNKSDFGKWLLVSFLPWGTILWEFGFSALSFIPYAGAFIYGGYAFTMWIAVSIFNSMARKKSETIDSFSSNKGTSLVYSLLSAEGIYFIISLISILSGVAMRFQQYYYEKALNNENKIALKLLPQIIYQSGSYYSAIQLRLIYKL